MRVFLAAAALLALTVTASAEAHGSTRRHRTRITTNAERVVVPRGRSIRIAYMPDLSGATSTFAPSIGNAVAMAVTAHAAVRGCPIRVDAVDTPCGDAGADPSPWYATVAKLPSDLAWARAYTARFGTAPSQFADLYYDATSLLIRTLQKTSSVGSDGDLVINKAALARAVRNTTNYQGVTCEVALDAATGYRANDPTALSRCAD